MSDNATTINSKQLDLLKGFFTHCWCVYHESAQQGFGFWAQQLDNAGIPWSVQNTVSVSAEQRASRGKYLTTILKERNIVVA